MHGCDITGKRTEPVTNTEHGWMKKPGPAGHEGLGTSSVEEERRELACLQVLHEHESRSPGQVTDMQREEEYHCIPPLPSLRPQYPPFSSFPQHLHTNIPLTLIKSNTSPARATPPPRPQHQHQQRPTPTGSQAQRHAGKRGSCRRGTCPAGPRARGRVRPRRPRRAAARCVGPAAPRVRGARRG